MFKKLTLSRQPTARWDELAAPTSMLLLLQACFGALIGVFVAMVIAHAMLPPDGPATSVPPGLLPEALPSLRVEPREKGFYLLSLFLGPLAGYLATGRLLRSPVLSIALGFVLLATIPLDTAFARRMLQGHLPVWVGLAAVLLLTLAAGIAINLWTVKLDPHRRIVVEERVGPRLSRSLWIYGGLLVALTLIVVPSSFVAVAAQTGLRSAYVSFIIGPSLYFLGNGLLPGVDYYAQYGIGLGWIFSLFPGHTIQGALLHYVALVVASTWLFYAHLLLVLRWLYRSWFVAAIIAFLSLILLFHTAVHFEAPSSACCLMSHGTANKPQVSTPDRCCRTPLKVRYGVFWTVPAAKAEWPFLASRPVLGSRSSALDLPLASYGAAVSPSLAVWARSS